ILLESLIRRDCASFTVLLNMINRLTIPYCSTSQSSITEEETSQWPYLIKNNAN
ncbi:23908_t:CDS:1, partial [Gigaspora rosea]